MKNAKFTNKSYISLNSWKTDHALFELMLSSPLRHDNCEYLHISEMDTLRDKHGIQKRKKS